MEEIKCFFFLSFFGSKILIINLGLCLIVHPQLILTFDESEHNLIIDMFVL